MEKAERDAIMRQGVVLPETPRQRRERAALEEDLQTIALTGKPLPIRARHFRPSADAYLLATRGPLAVHASPARDRAADGGARGDAARRLAGSRGRVRRGRRAVPAPREASARAEASFDEVNDLIDRHNRWYPVESRLPMDPRRGDYALVNGRDYRLDALDAAWVLERFPAELSSAKAAVP